MTRRIVALSPDRVPTLPGPCATCVGWEAPPGRVGALDEDAAGRVELKVAWLEEVCREWGPCGWVVLVDDQPTGYAVYAPPALVPGAERFPTAPVSPDAVLLTEVHAERERAGRGTGRLLVQRVAADLHRRGGYRALEAFGDARPTGSEGAEPRMSACLPPVEFLAAVGFGVQRDHDRFPRMRMDLRSTLTWRDGVSAVAARVRGAVRPTPTPGRQPGPARSSR